MCIDIIRANTAAQAEQTSQFQEMYFELEDPRPAGIPAQKISRINLASSFSKIPYPNNIFCTTSFEPLLINDTTFPKMDTGTTCRTPYIWC